MIPVILIILAAVGFVISSYFTAVSFGWIDPTEKMDPLVLPVGRADLHAGDFLAKSPNLRCSQFCLGPNVYILIIVGVFADLLFLKPFFFLFLAASSLTVLLAVYLSYSLLFLTRIRCFLCFTSHAINGIIFLILLLTEA